MYILNMETIVCSVYTVYELSYKQQNYKKLMKLNITKRSNQRQIDKSLSTMYSYQYSAFSLFQCSLFNSTFCFYLILLYFTCKQLTYFSISSTTPLCHFHHYLVLFYFCFFLHYFYFIYTYVYVALLEEPGTSD